VRSAGTIGHATSRVAEKGRGRDHAGLEKSAQCMIFDDTMNSIHMMADMDLSRVDLNLLVVFDALMRDKQATAAARRIRLTQGAVSYALRRLRDLFDDDLFIRRPGGMQPTQRALELYQSIQSALAHVEGALNSRLNFDPATATRTFRIAMTEVITLELLPGILRRLRARAPNVDIVVRACGAGEAADAVASEQAEIGIGVVSQIPMHMRSQELYVDSLVCVVDKRNSILKSGRVSRRDYLNAPHVTVANERHYGIELDEELARQGLKRRIVAVVPHYLAVPRIVRGTDLIGPCRGFVLLGESSHDLALVPIPFKSRLGRLRFLQVWHTRHDTDRGHVWLRDLIQESARDLGTK
jgi:DNA-binding transcriptional LysR family regulator